ncbi:MAG: hypothetical protein LUG17_00185 [Clostridiales bacterium]|nr:hypothetical protein [Clostridiales bacterium]
MTALNAEESNSDYILALVMVDGKKTTTTYLQHPFHKQPEWAANSVNYEIARLRQEGVVLLETSLTLED